MQSIIPGSGLHNLIPMGKISCRPRSDWHGILVADLKSSATPRDFVIIGSNFGFAIKIHQLAPIATWCAAFGMVSNEHEVCNRKNENKMVFPHPH